MRYLSSEIINLKSRCCSCWNWQIDAIATATARVAFLQQYALPDANQFFDQVFVNWLSGCNLLHFICICDSRNYAFTFYNLHTFWRVKSSVRMHARTKKYPSSGYVWATLLRRLHRITSEQLPARKTEPGSQDWSPDALTILPPQSLHWNKCSLTVLLIEVIEL